MANFNFQFYFQSGEGTVTVNGSPPASQYAEGTPLTIAVSFTDGSTDVQWIINNTDEGTDNPLSYNMPSEDVYIRILGSGAPEETDKYAFFWRFANGQGSLTVNGGVASPFYEAGESLQIETDLVPGFTFDNFNINNGLFVGGTNPYTFTMPAQDVDILINVNGEYTPVDNYGSKYFSEFCDIMGKEIVLDIKEKDYVGSSEQVKCAGVRYAWGNFGDDVLQTIVGSSINFGLVGARDKYFELLDGGNRKWQVTLTIDGSLFWVGYLSNSFLTVNEIETEQVQRFTAVDGLKSFESIRAIESFFTRVASGFPMASTLANMVNQSFDVLRPINMACSIYETRLDRNKGIFEQILVPDNAIYEDGEQPIFTSPGNVQLNTSLYLDECIDRMLKPFLCRLFLWKNEFYVISTPELNKDEYTLFNYDERGVSTGSETISEGLDLSCKFTAGQRTGRPVFTEFTNKFRLGVLDQAASGGLIEYDFTIDDWDLLGITSPYPNRYKLKRWKYVNARPSNRPDSYPTGTTTALVQYVSDAGNEYCKIWGTTSSAGLSDTNISYIEIDSYRNGNPISVAQEIVNTIAVNVQFYVEPRFGGGAVPPSTQKFGIMVRIGDSWMTWDGNQTFGWQGTENIMLFPLLNLYSWNTLDIRPILIPEDGTVTIRLYEVINDGGTADEYTIGYRNFSVKIEQNEAFVTTDVFDKFITDESYSLVYPEIETFIGDVPSDNSSSTIKLNVPEWNYPYSSLWSIDEVTEIRLSQVMLQEVANINGEPNLRLTATALRDGINPLEIVPLQNVVYDNSYWVVIAIDLDFQLDVWRIELVKLGDIGS